MGTAIARQAIEETLEENFGDQQALRAALQRQGIQQRLDDICRKHKLPEGAENN